MRNSKTKVKNFLILRITLNWNLKSEIMKSIGQFYTKSLYFWKVYIKIKKDL